MSSLNITELVAAFGDYLRENRGILVRELFLNEDYQSQFNVLDDVTDEVALPSLKIGGLLRPWRSNWDADADKVNFGGRTLKTRRMKADIDLIPQILYQSWLGKQKSNKDIYDMPFEQFIMQDLIAKAKDELTLTAIYKGVYNAAGTTSADTLTGFLKIIADEITATEVTPVATGVVTASNVITSVEATIDGLSEPYKNVMTEARVSPTLFTWYTRKYREVYGGNNDYTGMAKGRVEVDGTNTTLVRTPGLSGSSRIFVTPKENLYLGLNTTEGFNIEVEKSKRVLSILMDGAAGVEIANLDAISVNDQA